MTDKTTGPRELDADRICHDDQLRVWANDLVGALSLGEWLRDDLSYDDGIDVELAVMREIKGIVTMAIDHPERVKP